MELAALQALEQAWGGRRSLSECLELLRGPHGPKLVDLCIDFMKASCSESTLNIDRIEDAIEDTLLKLFLGHLKRLERDFDTPSAFANAFANIAFSAARNCLTKDIRRNNNLRGAIGLAKSPNSEDRHMKRPLMT